MALSSATPASSTILSARVGRALVVASWIAVAYGVIKVAPHPDGGRYAGEWVSALIFLVSFPLAYQRPGRTLLLTSGLAGVAMQALIPTNAAFIAVIATIAIAGTRLDPESGRLIAGLCGLGFLLVTVLGPYHLSAGEGASIAPGLLFTYVASAAIRRLRSEQRRTQELLHEVIAGRDALIQAAALEERARIAREMHDILAHTLSALSVQLEGARMLVEQRPEDPATVAAVERASRLAREGLIEARRAVASLRDESLPGPDLLPHLAEAFERDTGVPCRLHVEGQPRDLAPEARLAIYRAAQEALTNIRKHADATSVDIALRYTPHWTELTIENQGSVRPSPIESGGYGLSGMRERAELLGGTVEAGPTEGGFRVCLRLPR